MSSRMKSALNKGKKRKAVSPSGTNGNTKKRLSTPSQSIAITEDDPLDAEIQPISTRKPPGTPSCTPSGTPRPGTKLRQTSVPSATQKRPASGSNDAGAAVNEGEDSEDSDFSPEPSSAGSSDSCSLDEVHGLQKDEIEQLLEDITAPVHHPSHTKKKQGRKTSQSRVVSDDRSFLGLSRTENDRLRTMNERHEPVNSLKRNHAGIAMILESMDRLSEKVDKLIDLVSSGETLKSMLPAGSHLDHIPNPSENFKNIMRQNVRHIHTAFSGEVISKSIAHCIMRLILEQVQGDVLKPAGLLQVLRILFFAIQVKDSKEQHQKGAGPAASQFRKHLYAFVLRHAQKDSFGSFRPDNVEESDCDEIGHRKPEWLRSIPSLKEHFVLDVHLKNAQNRDEGVGTERDRERRRHRSEIGKGIRRVGRHDKAEYVAEELILVVKKKLHEGRKRGPREYTAVLGYIYEDWKKHPSVTVDQGTMSLAWRTRLSECAELNPRDIPASNTFLGDDGTALQKKPGDIRIIPERPR